jgi:glycosyltransferase involved in cell wall biosynthesis
LLLAREAVREAIVTHISAVVCTHNRSLILRLALDSLVHQSLAPDRYEIIVVANGCTDDTSAVVEEFRRSHPRHQIRVVSESRLGLGFARAAGIAHSRGDCIAFLDDDARASPTWLKRALEHFSREGLAVLCIGGKTLPLYLTAKPWWFLDSYETASHGDHIRWLREGESFNGSNMIWRRATLQDLPGFSPQLGPRGADLAVGEETLLFQLLWRAETTPRFLYDPELTVEHLVPAAKMTLAYRWKRAYVAGRDWYQAYGPRTVGGRSRFAIRKGVGLAAAVALSPAHLPAAHGLMDWFVCTSQQIATRLGVLLAALGVSLRVSQATLHVPEPSQGAKLARPAHAA